MKILSTRQTSTIFTRIIKTSTSGSTEIIGEGEDVLDMDATAVITPHPKSVHQRKTVLKRRAQRRTHRRSVTPGNDLATVVMDLATVVVGGDSGRLQIVLNATVTKMLYLQNANSTQLFTRII